MPFDDPAYFRLDRIPVWLIHMLERLRKDGWAFWQWSNPTLPHGAGRRP